MKTTSINDSEKLEKFKYSGIMSSQINPNTSFTNLTNLTSSGRIHEPIPNKFSSPNQVQFASFQLPLTPPVSKSSTPFKERDSFSIPSIKSESGVWSHKWFPKVDIKIAALCLNWYFFSIISSNSTKIILSDFKYPVTLTQFQFSLNSFFCLSLLFVVLNNRKYSSYFPEGSIPKLCEISSLSKFMTPTKFILSTTLPMGLFQFVGHITSHKATSLIPVSMVHTIKALSPIITVLIYRVLFRVHFKIITYITLIPLIVGIMITCYKPNFKDQSFYLTGLTYAFISMLIFVSQNIFAKKRLTHNSTSLPISNQEKKEEKLDKLTILFYCSATGFCFTLPIYLISEFRNPVFSLSELSAKVLLFILVNGLSHFLQSLLAFQILGSISPINYSIANIMKRIVIILFSFIWENKDFTSSQSYGLILTIVGLYCYDTWGL